MAKQAKSRAAAKKIKDKWKSKEWYRVLAPPVFERREVAETLTDDPNKLLGRVVITTPNEIAPDSGSSNPARPFIKMLLQVHDVKDKDCETRFIGHELTSDYVRRLARRRKTKVDVVFDVASKDATTAQYKVTAIADKRIQASQETALRHIIARSSTDFVVARDFNDVIRGIINGEMSRAVSQACKAIYPLRRIEVSKSEVAKAAFGGISAGGSAAAVPAVEGTAPVEGVVAEGASEASIAEAAPVEPAEESTEPAPPEE